jgi:hypothetical protein
MTTASSTEQNSKENVEAGQFLASQRYKSHQQQSQHDHQSQPDRFSHMMDPRQSGSNHTYPGSAINQNNSHQGGSNQTSSENKLEIPGMGTSAAATSAATAQTALSGDNPNNHGDTTSSMMTNASGDSIIGQDAPKHPNSTTATAPNHPQDSSDLSHRSGPRTEGLRNDSKEGFERKIGRGTSWRRDHDARGDKEYTVRGRGRGASSRSRGYRNNHFDYDSRDYYNNRRGNDRRAPYQPRPPPPHSPSNLPPAPAHPSLDPRGPPYPPPDPYYDSRGTYPSPTIYDARRDYPPDPARYFDDYHRGGGGYDPRDVPPPLPRAPPSPIPPPNQTLESGRPYDRIPLLGRDDPSDYGRSYARPRDPRDDYRGDPREADPRLPPRYMDEGI